MPRDLAQGSAGPDVNNLQALLNFHLSETAAVPLVRDGIFGPKTREAVVTFQGLNNLTPDGIVGPHTRSALLDARASTMGLGLVTGAGGEESHFANLLAQASSKTGVRFPRQTFQPQRAFAQVFAANTPVAQGAPPAPTPTPAPATPQVNAQSAVVQVGQQVNLNPWFFSPFVLSGQWNILIKNDGRRPFLISPGVQFFLNQAGSPAGRWSGQGFIQMGPTELFKRGQFDLLNPFVQAFIQKNDGQPFSTGFAIGNQANWNVLGDKLSLFVNAQEVFAVDLSNGRAAAPSTQILGGVGFDIFQLLPH